MNRRACQWAGCLQAPTVTGIWWQQKLELCAEHADQIGPVDSESAVEGTVGILSFKVWTETGVLA